MSKLLTKIRLKAKSLLLGSVGVLTLVISLKDQKDMLYDILEGDIIQTLDEYAEKSTAKVHDITYRPIKINRFTRLRMPYTGKKKVPHLLIKYKTYKFPNHDYTTEYRAIDIENFHDGYFYLDICLLYTSPSPRDS